MLYSVSRSPLTVDRLPFTPLRFSQSPATRLQSPWSSAPTVHRSLFTVDAFEFGYSSHVSLVSLLTPHSSHPCFSASDHALSLDPSCLFRKLPKYYNKKQNTEAILAACHQGDLLRHTISISGICTFLTNSTREP